MRNAQPNRRSIEPAVRPSVRGPIAVTAIMGTRIACLTRVAAERIPADRVCCDANSRGIYTATVIYTAAVVRESVVGNECGAHERCGRKAEDHVARHGHLPLCEPIATRPHASLVPALNNSSRLIVPARQWLRPHSP